MPAKPTRHRLGQQRPEAGKPARATQQDSARETQHERNAQEEIEEAIAKDRAVERGERIQTGKTIARGGQHTGYVEGATESPPPK